MNVAEIARECVASRNTVESYLGILEDLLIAVRVPVFRWRAKRAVVAHGKFYFFDCGVFRSLRPAELLDTGGDSERAALEGLVLQHLRAWIGTATWTAACISGARAAGRRRTSYCTGRPRPADLRGIRVIPPGLRGGDAAGVVPRHRHPAADGVRCMPVDRFLRDLVPGRESPT